jgi:hypothetical protein
MKKTFFLIFVFVFSFPLFSDELKYELIQSENPENIDYNIKDNKFYPSYYILTDIFSPFELYNKISTAERRKITDYIVKSISEFYAIRLEIKKYIGDDDLIISLKPVITPNNQTVIMMITNYIVNEKKLTEYSLNNDEMKNAYAVFYTIKNDKMFRNKYLYDKKKENELKASKNILSLADYYVMDDNDSNDNEAKNLLLNEIKTNKDEVRVFYSVLTLFEFYMINKNYPEAKKTLDNGKQLLEKMTKNKEKYESIYAISEDLYDILK